MLPKFTNHTLSILEISESFKTSRETDGNISKMYDIINDQFTWTPINTHISKSHGSLITRDDKGGYNVSSDFYHVANLIKFSHKYIMCVGGFSRQLMDFLLKCFEPLRVRGFIIAFDLADTAVTRSNYIDNPNIQFVDNWSSLIDHVKLDTRSDCPSFTSTTLFSSYPLGRTQTIPYRKLYWMNNSIQCWRVMSVLYELGIKFEQHLLKPSDTHSYEILKLNPKGEVPIFVDRDGFVLYGSIATMEYLVESYGGLTLLLPYFNNKTKGLIRSRIYESDTLMTIFEPMKILSNSIETLSKQQIKEAIEAKNKLYKELMLWDMYLQDNTYMVNKTFTLADCGAYPVISNLVHYGLNLIKYPYINRYYTLLKQHPSIIKSSPICWKEYSDLNIFIVADALTKR